MKTQPVVIKEIWTKKDKKKFFKFTIDLYKGNPHASPNFYFDEFPEFDPQQNDAFRFCECKMFLAYRGKKVVGRIAGILHKFVNQKNNVKQLRFTRFDVVDDFEVTKALFSKILEWAKELGMDEIIGPMSFSDLNEEGMLIDGFDRDSTYIEIYNHPYYVTHMEKLGAHKVVDWNCYIVPVPSQQDERLSRIAKHVKERNGYEIADVARLQKIKGQKELKNIMMQCLDVMNESYENLFGTSILSEKQRAREVKSLLDVFIPELACAVLKEGKVVCYGMCIPSMLKAMQKGKGHIIPFGLVEYIKTMSHPQVADMMSVAVTNEHKNRGAVSIVMDEILKGCIKLGIKRLETGPELEDNLEVQNLWKNYGRELVKRHRCWGVSVADLEKTLSQN